MRDSRRSVLERGNIMSSVRCELMKVKGGASAIATFTFDDGVSKSSWRVREIMEKYRLVATLMLVPSRIMGIAPYSTGYLDKDGIAAITEGGFIDIESHSFSHLYISEVGHPDYHPENCNDENRYRETVGSYEWFRKEFPERSFVSFAVPGGNYDTRTHDLLKSTFYSVRNGRLLGEDDMQTLTPTDDRENGGWYKLKKIWLRESESEKILSHLDKCVREGGWFFTGCHNIVGDEIGKHNYEMTPETFEMIVKKIAEYRDSGRIWCASMGDATRYLREYESSYATAELDGNKLTVKVTMKDKTPAGLPLPNSIFNIPLTVRVYPEGREALTLEVKPNETVTVEL